MVCWEGSEALTRGLFTEGHAKVCCGQKPKYTFCKDMPI